MSNVTTEIATQLVYIPFGEGVDAVAFSEGEESIGIQMYVEVATGIVVAKEHEELYLNVMKIITQSEADLKADLNEEDNE